MKVRLRVVNRTRRTVLVSKGSIASDLWSRFVGLMGRRRFEPGEGLLLKGEQAIHTFGMCLAIDVLFLDRERRVLRVVHSIAPARIAPFVRGTRDVLELPAGTCAATGTREGDQLDLEPVQ